MLYSDVVTLTPNAALCDGNRKAPIQRRERFPHLERYLLETTQLQAVREHSTCSLSAVTN